MVKVSIIVPVYNVEKYLARCLDSLLNQTFSDYEIICVNDCTPDNSQQILDTYKKNNPEKIKLLKNETNIGLGRTREHGIAESEGEYLMFIDSDDYVKTDFIETYYNSINNTEYDMVVGGFIRDVDGSFKTYKMSESIWSMVTHPVAWAKIYRKSFITSHGIEYTDIRCGEDIPYALTLFAEDIKYRVIDYAGYYYYFNRNSITGAMRNNKKLEVFIKDIFDGLLNKYPRETLSKYKSDVFEYVYISNMINALIVYGRGCGTEAMKEKYDFFKKDLIEKFPEYRNNPFVGLAKPKGQTLKIRAGVGVLMGLEKIGLDKVLLNLISIM